MQQRRAAVAMCSRAGLLGSRAQPAATFVNRNPRNLERMRIADKPAGYFLERPGRQFWHRLELASSGRHVTARVEHFQGGVMVRASTQEWALKKQLYRLTDESAYTNLARVLAQRCLECGLTELRCDVSPEAGGAKLGAFLRALQEGGVRLSEPTQYLPARPWDMHRPERPWDVADQREPAVNPVDPVNPS